MSLYFFDSSALIKRYIVEVGSSWVQHIAQSLQDNIVISHIAHVEMISAIMRRQRENTITHQMAQTTKILIDNHAYYQYEVITFTDDIIKIADMLLSKYPLRSLDAIQLASAVKAKQNLVGNYPFIFVSSDKRLLGYANSEGLTTDNPNNYP